MGPRSIAQWFAVYSLILTWCTWDPEFLKQPNFTKSVSMGIYTHTYAHVYSYAYVDVDTDRLILTHIHKYIYTHTHINCTTISVKKRSLSSPGKMARLINSSFSLINYVYLPVGEVHICMQDGFSLNKGRSRAHSLVGNFLGLLQNFYFLQKSQRFWLRKNWVVVVTLFPLI